MNVNQITIFLPGAEPRTYTLDQYQRNYVLMGRGVLHGNSQMHNDIQIDESYPIVSRAHCIFQRNEAGFWQIVDRNSTNGLYFSDQKVQIHTLSDGDKVYIGSKINERVVILFTSRPAMEGAQPAPQAQAWPNGNDTQTVLLSDVQDSFSAAHDNNNGVKYYPLSGKDVFTIGRSPDSDIVLNHPSVSRRHCTIACQNGQYYIYDNNSTNGIILNSQMLNRAAVLNEMDRISIAGFSFIFCNQCLYSYELSGGVSISISQLYKEVGKRSKKKFIMNDVNLFVEPNKFVALIGSSGAGKTTLLNCMSGMTDFTAGEVLINGESIRTSAKSLRSLMGYVPQQDIVYDSLSLERMLLYSARLRMPKDTSKEEIQAKINEVLEVVELSDHRNTLISKLSGGERKRASIAVELLASPKLFFLDEPSSGLDPGTEKHLMQMLKRLSETGKTVVMVTHTVQNLDLCDTVICMGRGGVLCYAGSPKDAPAFFGKRSLTDIYDDLSDNSIATAARYRDIAKSQVETPTTELAFAEKPTKIKKGPLAGIREFWVMACRYVEIMKNNPARMLLLLLMPIFLSLLVCVAFQADGGLYNFLMANFGMAFTRDCFPFYLVIDTKTLLFAFSCAVFWTGIFNSIQEVSKERSIYEREKFSGIGAVPYVMSKFIPLSVLCLIQSLLMDGIIIFMTNTAATVDGNPNSVSAIEYSMPSDGAVLGSGLMGLEVFITTYLCMLSAMCLGLMISTLTSNEMALVLCPICLMPQILFSGVVSELSGITLAISEFITCKWSCLAFFVSSGISDTSLYHNTCEYSTSGWVTDANGEAVANAAYERGTEYVFGLHGVESGWLVMGIMCLVCVVASMLILRFKRSKVR